MTSTSSSGNSDSDSDNSSSGTEREHGKRSEELERSEATERSEYFGVSDGRSTAGTSIVDDEAISESHGDASGGSDSSSEEVMCPLAT